ncbi:MAG: hypothetical protein EAZ18_25475 [Oscillatoriales cyanobacterium]|nr:MAG: hypothetical protein EAZ18_25475 [Oscillatoriales cyanobacterium]
MLVTKSWECNSEILHHCQQQARCLFHKDSIFLWNRLVSNRQDACSTKTLFSCGTGILPVHKRLIENGATSQLK